MLSASHGDCKGELWRQKVYFSLKQLFFCNWLLAQSSDVDVGCVLSFRNGVRQGQGHLAEAGAVLSLTFVKLLIRLVCKEANPWCYSGPINVRNLDWCPINVPTPLFHELRWPSLFLCHYKALLKWNALNTFSWWLHVDKITLSMYQWRGKCRLPGLAITLPR